MKNLDDSLNQEGEEGSSDYDGGLLANKDFESVNFLLRIDKWP